MSKYTLENGAIMADGQQIARHDAARNVVVSLEPLHHKVKSSISRLIDPNPDYEVEAVQESSVIPPEPGPKDVIPEVPAPIEAMETPPATDPALGDKTPAYVEWFRRTHSAEEFAAKYRGRKIPGNLDSALAEPVISNHMPTVE
jgi:hypothetical protein